MCRMTFTSGPPAHGWSQSITARFHYYWGFELVEVHGTVYRTRMSERPNLWDAARVLALRERLGMTQRQLADELGVRQQTVSEWETGAYRPRGASARMLRHVAERAGVDYDAGAPDARTS